MEIRMLEKKPGDGRHVLGIFKRNRRLGDLPLFSEEITEDGSSVLVEESLIMEPISIAEELEACESLIGFSQHMIYEAGASNDNYLVL